MDLDLLEVVGILGWFVVDLFRFCSGSGWNSTVYVRIKSFRNIFQYIQIFKNNIGNSMFQS